MQIRNFVFLSLVFVFISCGEKCKIKNETKLKSIESSLENITDYEKIEINKNGFYGVYVGQEFTKDGDVAHQFSNKTSKVISRFLKKSFRSGTFLKINFSDSEIKTIGLDKKGKVKFIIQMKFVETSKSDAFTGIAHCGTWVNQNNLILDSRDQDLLRNLNKISVGPKEQGYFTTPEGYKEYWVQFKHKNFQ